MTKVFLNFAYDLHYLVLKVFLFILMPPVPSLSTIFNKVGRQRRAKQAGLALIGIRGKIGRKRGSIVY